MTDSPERAWSRLLILTAVAAVFLGQAMLVMHTGDQPWWSLATWLVVLLPGLAVAWLGRDWLFGPILWYDLVRRARQGRQLLQRTAYGIALLSIFYLVYAERFKPRGVADWFETQTLRHDEAPRFANDLFVKFMLLQYLAAWLLTPLLLAPAITEERERGTLDLLLASDLSAREVVLGKVVAGAGFMAQLVLTSLPIQALLVFLGGIAPEQVLAGFLLTLLILFTAACLSLAVSAGSSNTTAALLISYLISLPLAVFCVSLPMGFLDTQLLWAQFSLQALVLLSISVVLLRFAMEAVRPVDFAKDPVREAVAALRLQVAAPTIDVRDESPQTVYRVQSLPPIGDWPLLWKECYLEEVSQGGELARFVKGVTMLIGPVAALMYVVHLTVPGERAAAARWAVTLLTVVWLGGVLLLAAGAISRERERRTLESLLGTPLSIKEILAAKAIGCLYGAGWVGALLAGVLALSLATGGLPLAGGLLLPVGWTIWTALFISLGMWYSTYAPSTTRSVFLTVVSGALLLVGPPLLARPLSRLALHLDWSWMDVLMLEDALFFGLSPATGTAALANPDSAKPWVLASWPICVLATLLLVLDMTRRLQRETER